MRSRSLKIRDQSRKVNELSKVRDQFHQNRFRDRRQVQLAVLNGFKRITFYYSQNNKKNYRLTSDFEETN